MALYSHSKLSTFEQCKLKYKFKYIDKIKPEIEKTIEAHLGSAVHSTLEWLYIQLKNGPTPTIDETIMHYHHEWQKGWSEEIVIVKKELTKQNYFEKGIKFLIDYYLTNQPFDENTLEIEKRVFVKIDEHKIQGYIDRLVFNKETGEYEIHDYKTSGTLPTQEKIENDRQLALYSIAINELYGFDKKVKLIWHYLNFNTKITSSRTEEQIEELKQKIKSLIEEIESTTEFPHEVSTLCDWCEFKPICPAWNNNQEIVNSKEQRDRKLNDFPTLAKYLKE